MGKTIVKGIAWMLAFGALALAFAGPEDPFLDRPVWAGYALLLMVFLATWDERNARFRLPFRLPAEALLVLPLGLLAFILTRIRWPPTEGPDQLKLINGLLWLGFYVGLLLESRLKGHRKAL